MSTSSSTLLLSSPSESSSPRTSVLLPRFVPLSTWSLPESLSKNKTNATSQVAASAFLSYWLVKIVPYWGLALLATTLLFTVPLIYTSNQELIDHHIKNAQDIVSAQTEQLRQVAGTHTAKATEVTKQYVGDYTTKAQELLKGKKSVSSPVPASNSSPAHSEPVNSVKDTDFPAAPKEDIQFKESVAAPSHEGAQEPLIAA